jgi:hypothetical protein
VVFWERPSREEQAETLRALMDELRAHHQMSDADAAHPEHGFNVPAWDGPAGFSAAALLGNAPAWAH